MYKMILSTKDGILRYGIEGYGVRIEDISEDPARLNLLVRNCNEGELDPGQLQDVVEDWLAAEFSVL